MSTVNGESSVWIYYFRLLRAQNISWHFGDLSYLKPRKLTLAERCARRENEAVSFMARMGDPPENGTYGGHGG